MNLFIPNNFAALILECFILNINILKKNKKIFHPFPLGRYAIHFNPEDFQNYVCKNLNVSEENNQIPNKELKFAEGLGKNNTSISKTTKAWEFYDLENDPLELKNEFSNPFYKDEIISLREELVKIKNSIKDKETIVPEISKI